MLYIYYLEILILTKTCENKKEITTKSMNKPVCRICVKSLSCPPGQNLQYFLAKVDPA